jgi:DNA-binding LacI/PurR family transcriptional regulator
MPSPASLPTCQAQGRATARDVAAVAGVSTSAVSRTFAKGASVSPVTRNKVADAAHRLGYRPNLLARSLTTKRTELIGLVSNNFENPLFLEIFHHFTRSNDHAVDAVSIFPSL